MNRERVSTGDGDEQKTEGKCRFDQLREKVYFVNTWKKRFALKGQAVAARRENENAADNGNAINRAMGRLENRAKEQDQTQDQANYFWGEKQGVFHLKFPQEGCCCGVDDFEHGARNKPEVDQNCNQNGAGQQLKTGQIHILEIFPSIIRGTKKGGREDS